MKYPFIRRAAALALALVLALTMSVSLIVPGWAADETAYEITITSSKDSLKVGDTAVLTATWVEGKKPEEEVEYKWTFEGVKELVTEDEETAGAAEIEDSITVTVTATETGKAKITLNVTKKDGGDPIATATYDKLEVTAADDDTETVPVTGVSLNKTTLNLTVGASETLTATVNPATATDKTVTWSSDKEAVATVKDGKVTAVSAGEAIITATSKADNSKTATCKVTVTAGGGTTETVPVTRVSLDKTELNLTVGGTATLEATVWPANATDKTVTWSSDKESVATVENGKVTAKSAGEANITATTKDGGKTATCKVTVAAATPTLSISGSRNTTMDPGTLTITATMIYAPADAVIEWSVARKTGQTGTKLPENPTPKVEQDGTTIRSTVTYTFNGAGDFIITAKCGAYSETKNVTISGLVLSGDKLELKKNETTGAEEYIVTMYVNGSATLVATPYGNADDRNLTKVTWTSSNASVVYVMPSSGNLNAWGKGKAVITAAKGKYSEECEVVVQEDTSVIASGYTASVKDPLNFWDDGVYQRLQQICLTKTKEMSTQSALSYITNLSVSPDQGTLYYNYSTESDTGDGVGYNDQFAETARGAVRSASRLYFVPAQGFVGTAEITFSGVAVSGQNFTGVIRVNVSAGSGSGTGSEIYQISYRVRAGEPVWFQADDFNTYCQQHPNSGRSFNYVTFSLPKASEGTLYYNYMAGSGNPVSTSLRFTPTGQYAVDNVCFVPSAAYNGGDVTVSFRAVDTSGGAVDGTVIVSVIAASDDDPSSVTLSGGRGRPVALQGELFNAACQATINDTLSFVTFKLPDPDLGALYVNYQSEDVFESRVTAGTRCYYSGVPGLNSVSFVPASGASGRIAISYTGYGSRGASYGGTLYITLGDTGRSDIHYFVTKGDSVSFSAYDFSIAGQYTVGSSVSFVVFTGISDRSLGTLYCKTGTNSNITSTVSYSEKANNFGSSYVYYVNPSTTSQRGLNRVYFDTKDAKNTTGTVTIFYTAFSGTANSSSNRRELFSGKVVIQVGALAPDDINLSCNTSGQVRLSATTLNSVCSAATGGNLSHIEITSVPDAKEGHLYYNYSVFGTGTDVKQGDRFYRVGSYNINQLTFIPHAGFTGDVEITYIGYDGDGHQVSGRIIVSVAKTKTSQYFTDMKGYSYANDAVDYLRRNGVVKGTGSGVFSPGGTITRGDFVLMLVRAYGFTASGSSPFRDVPAGSYYADAIRIAYQLGIVKGSGGYFYPKNVLTRQDAMVMIYNALKISGKTATNGLAADFSAYLDAEEISSYAREAMGSLIQMGVVKGVGNGYLQPKRLLKRAEAAVLLHAIMTL